MALLACTGMFMRLDTMRLVLVMRVESIEVSIFMPLWHLNAITTSSNAVLPARSPMPFMVTST